MESQRAGHDEVTFTLLHKVCGNPVLRMPVSAVFPIAFDHSVTLACFGNHHHISKFFIIIFAVVTYNQ